MSAAGAPATRTGFVAIVGRPSVGKSTLLNALVGERVSITSRRPQTTRQRINGVLTRTAGDGGREQFIFVDTPGFQRGQRTLLARRMNESVRTALADVDAIVLVVDAKGWTQADEQVLALLPAPGGRARVVLAINKIDRLTDRNALLPLMAASAARHPFSAIVPVSAEKGVGLSALLDELARLLPPGEPLFPPDQYTDRSARFLAAEFVREKAFRLLGDELPHGLAVEIEGWHEEERPLRIQAALLVDRESHKGMVIGKGGAKLREIGRLARADIERMVGRPVFLEIHVRVRRGWSDDAAALSRLGHE